MCTASPALAHQLQFGTKPSDSLLLEQGDDTVELPCALYPDSSKIFVEAPHPMEPKMHKSGGAFPRSPWLEPPPNSILHHNEISN